MAMYVDFRQPAGSGRARPAFTLVEMLVAMAITLVMMAAVVTLFANVSGSVRNRRATIEMSSQLRHLRNVLQQDLQGATCPGATWQRPESNLGYIEIIEGQYKEGYASNLIDGVFPPTVLNPEIDHKASSIPSSNLPYQSDWATDAAGLGDFDDILMLTVRNEHEPFIGRAPFNVRPNTGNAMGFANWTYTSVESPLAEVVWYAVENAGYTDDPNDATDGESDPTAENFFGEPGLRTIYRRTLLIAPWLNPYQFIDSNGNVHDTFSLDGESDTFQARPGLLRVLKDNIDREDLDRALASLIAFQERYDISARLEFDPDLDAADGGRYVILANTLGDLTKRENRYEHHSFRPGRGSGGDPSRDYPYAVISMGSGYSGSNQIVRCVPEREPDNDPAVNEGRAELQDAGGLTGVVVTYTLREGFPPADPNPVRTPYRWRPFAYVVQEDSGALATARVMINDRAGNDMGEVVRIVHGLVPLAGERRGEDVMMTGVLGFDLRVYDPGAPMFATRQTPGDASSPLDVVLTPSDPGWRGPPPDGLGGAYMHGDNMNPDGSGKIGDGDGGGPARFFPYVGQGAYVDMGYGYDARFNDPFKLLPIPGNNYNTANFGSSEPAWFFEPRGLSDVYYDSRPANQKPWSLLAPGYAVYDTWSFHYENNGVNEDGSMFDGSSWQQVDVTVDEGVNGLDDLGNYSDSWDVRRLGIDDIGERETVPPYDRPLRGMQVIIRTYEPDSRAIRQVRVNQHFMQE